MTAVVAGCFACLGSFIFLNRPLARACGGEVMLLYALLMDVAIGVGVWILLKN